MAHAIKQPKFISPIKFKTFSKYDFVKSYSATAKNDDIRKEKEQEAAIIADAIEETQGVLLENLATKEDLRVLELSTKENLTKEIKMLEISLKKEMQGNFIKLVVVMTGLFTFLPLATDFIRHLFRF